MASPEKELTNSLNLKTGIKDIKLSDFYKTFYPIEKDISILDSVKSERINNKMIDSNEEKTTEKKSGKSTKSFDSINLKNEKLIKENENPILIENSTKRNKEDDKENLKVSDIKIEIIKKKMSEIFAKRNKTFIEEFERYNFTYTTTVEYYNKNKYIKATLIISDNRLYILQFEKPKTRLNLDETLIEKMSSKKGKLSEQKMKELYDISYPLLSLNFNTITCKLLIEKKTNSLIIKVLSLTPHTFRIKFPNKEILNKYIIIINNSIKSSEGNKENLFGISLRFNDYHKNNVLTTEEFENIAKTGDILLFQGNECTQNLQRFFTRDEYDHVALVRKNGCTLFIYEATSIRKCSTMVWDAFKYDLFPLVYGRIVYRRLIIEEKDENKKKEIQKKIEKDIGDFIKDTFNKEYYLSISSILCCKSPEDYEKNNKWNLSKGFSCSALLTACYYKAGILTFENGVHSKLPGHFSQDKYLNFTKGFSLGPEKLIEFSE